MVLGYGCSRSKNNHIFHQSGKHGIDGGQREAVFAPLVLMVRLEMGWLHPCLWLLPSPQRMSSGSWRSWGRVWHCCNRRFTWNRYELCSWLCWIIKQSVCVSNDELKVFLSMRQALLDTLSPQLASIVPGFPNSSVLRDLYSLLGEGGQRFPSIVLDSEPDWLLRILTGLPVYTTALSKLMEAPPQITYMTGTAC